MGRSEEQSARNEAVFREANERIAERRAELTAIEGQTPFLCECEDEACSEIVRMSTDDYERVRSDAAQFLIATGHSHDGGEVVFAGDGWTCIRKNGVGAEIGRETDPRG